MRMSAHVARDLLNVAIEAYERGEVPPEVFASWERELLSHISKRQLPVVPLRTLYCVDCILLESSKGIVWAYFSLGSVAFHTIGTDRLDVEISPAIILPQI